MSHSDILISIRKALLAAIIFVLSLTPIGYLKVGLFDITFLTIPVIVGAITTGPAVGAFLGAVFGLTSFMQAIFGLSPLGSVLFSINPVFSALLCFIPRILMGWLCGLLYRGLNRKGNDSVVSICISSIAGALMNTVFFMSAFMLLFGNTDYVLNMRGGANVLAFLVAMVGVNGVVEAISCAIVGTAISKPLLKLYKPVQKRITLKDVITWRNAVKLLLWAIIFTVTSLSIISLKFYCNHNIVGILYFIVCFITFSIGEMLCRLVDKKRKKI